MFIPLRTERRTRRRSVVTPALILANMLVYLGGLMLDRFDIATMSDLVDWGKLSRETVASHRLITYQFLHDPSSILHLAFNMLFLWVFGTAIEDRLGRGGFAGFYLLGGVVAGIAHTMIDAAPVIGASGSVSAVSGAFLALYPRARIQVLVLFILIGIISVPAMVFVGIFIAIDLLRSVGDLMGGGSNVAYAAHLAGTAYGFFLSIVLLATGILRQDDFDIWFLFKQNRRRAAFRRAHDRSPTGAPWDTTAAPPPTAPATAPAPRRRGPEDGPTPEQIEETSEQREAIGRLITEHRLPEAAAAYRDLLETAPRATLSEDRQLDLANQLNADGDATTAARAYQLFLDRFGHTARAPQVRLLLALLLGRSLGRVVEARALAARAADEMRPGPEQDLAIGLRDELAAADGSTSTDDADHGLDDDGFPHEAADADADHDVADHDFADDPATEPDRPARGDGS